MTRRRDKVAELWALIGALHELHDAATRRQIRRMRVAVRLVLDMIDRERERT